MKAGTRIFGPHGPGTIVSVKESSPPVDPFKHDLIAIACLPPAMVLESFYGPDRYPFVVQFDCGYKDVYSAESLEELTDQEYHGCSDICPPTYARRFAELYAQEAK
jgi:hypothetical protein